MIISPRRKNRRGWAVSLLIILVLLALIGGGIYYFVSTESNSEDPKKDEAGKQAPALRPASFIIYIGSGDPGFLSPEELSIVRSAGKLAQETECRPLGIIVSNRITRANSDSVRIVISLKPLMIPLLFTFHALQVSVDHLSRQLL